MILAVACTPVVSETNNRYQLTEAQQMKPSTHQHGSILIMRPVALEGYDTQQMLYVNQPYQVSAFANNSWMSPPATMLLPLILRSIESTHYFSAVTSDLNTTKTDYRLESTLIRFQQNFLLKPSHLQIAMQIVLVRSMDSQVMATATLYEDIPCPKDTPLGGVMAANQATKDLTAKIARFVVKQVKKAQ